MAFLLGLAAAAGEADVHSGAAHRAGGIEEQRVVHALNVAVHQCDHGLLLGRIALGVDRGVLFVRLVVLRVMEQMLFGPTGVGRAGVHDRSKVVSCNGDGHHLVLVLLSGRR